MPEQRIIHGDCIREMQEMEPGSVDLVFTSPPYEDARTYGIDFKLKGQDWVDWCMPRFQECVRVCRGLVAWVVEGKTRSFRWSATPVVLMADLHRAGVRLRKPPAFHRVGIPGSGGPDWLRNDYEFIVCASHGKLPWSDNVAMGHPPKWAPGGAMSHRLTDGTRRNQWGGGANSTGGERGKDGVLRNAEPKPSHVIKTKQDRSYVPPKNANPGNMIDCGSQEETSDVIRCVVGGGVMGPPLAHENEAPFPESLAEFFIRSFCPPGGTVLDPFCGSGTTLSVARREGRSSIGIDIRQSQVYLSQRRIDATDVQSEMARRRIANPEPEPVEPDVSGQEVMDFAAAQ